MKSNTELLNLLKDFYKIVHIRIAIFDIYCNIICQYPEEGPKYCNLVRQTKDGLKGCQNCDMSACLRAKESKKSEIYTCHAGLTEAIVPIHFNNDIVGFGVLAHLLNEENYETDINEAIKRAKKMGIKEEDARKALLLINSYKKDEINASVNLLKGFASYLYWNNLLEQKQAGLPLQISNFIKENLSSNINSVTLCKKFFISRTSLYRLSKQNFGMPINRYITKIKMNQAKALLEIGKSTKEVSYYCGMENVSYFNKMFKKEIGVTPSIYRKNYKKVDF